MKLNFIESEEPIFTTDPYYDLFEGGYISPEKVLEDQSQIDKVREALEIVGSFVSDMEESGIIEIG